MKKDDKIEILTKTLFEMFSQDQTELNYQTPYQLLIAVMMSAQTTDKQVNKANEKFFKIVKKPQDAIDLGVANIKNYIKTIWFFNVKANNIYKTSIILKEKYKNKIPKSLEELQELPWVGVKTAKVVCAILYDMPVLAVDTHVHRVLNRIWIVKTKSPIETDKIAAEILNKDASRKLHHSLIFFWRYHCLARKPKCIDCPLKYICHFYKKNN